MNQSGFPTNKALRFYRRASISYIRRYESRDQGDSEYALTPGPVTSELQNVMIDT